MCGIAGLMNPEGIGAEPDRLRGSPGAGVAEFDRMNTKEPPRLVSTAHILYVIDSLAGWAGAEGFLLRTIRLLPKDRYKASIVTFKTKPYIGSLDQFPCPVHVLPLDKTYDWKALKAALELRRLIRSEKVDIVHTLFETSDIWGGIIARLSGCPILVSSRRDMGILRTTKHQIAYRLLNSLFDQVQTVSDQVRSFAIEHDGIAPHKVITIHNGVDVERAVRANSVDRYRSSLGLDGASHLICTVGHIRWIKGTDILIQAAARVLKEFPRAVFLVIGGVLEQDYFRDLQELARSLQVEHAVRFLGNPIQHVSYQGETDIIFSLLKMCDVFCLTSRSEGLSNALLEAMACGLPCVATRVGGNPEVIEHGISGFLVPSEDPVAVADSILAVLCDPRRKAMGEAGRRTVATRFSTEVMVERLLRSYDELRKGRLS